MVSYLSARFAAMYSAIGRPSSPPEQLLRAWLLQALYTVRRERLLASDVAGAFFDAVVVNSTQLDAWASLKSFPRREAPRPPPDDPGHPPVHFHGERRSKATHRSTTDPDAQLCRTGGAGAVLSYLGHVVLDNRHGLGVNPCVTAATGTAAWDAVERLLADVRRGPVAGDKELRQAPLRAPSRAKAQRPKPRASRPTRYFFSGLL